jgi:dTDP-4-dehydrorhamnose reductase
MKILLLGKNGQLGWELQRSLLPLGEVIAFDRLEQSYCADLSKPEGIAETIRAIRPDIIVNPAAYTAVDKAETEVDLARLINGVSPGVMAEEAKRYGARLIHFSTDYVFDGSGDLPWQESDQVAPLNMYGQTKLEGEQAILATGCQHLIFRTSWVYAARGNNFAKIMLRLAQERDSLNVINDQFGAPTSAELLSDVTAHAIRKVIASPEISGVYHLTAAGDTSWYDYAQFVLACALQLELTLKVGPEGVNAIPTTSYPTPAQRPHNSRLNTNKLKNEFQVVLPTWQVGIERMLTELYGKLA